MTRNRIIKVESKPYMLEGSDKLVTVTHTDWGKKYYVRPVTAYSYRLLCSTLARMVWDGTVKVTFTDSDPSKQWMAEVGPQPPLCHALPMNVVAGVCIK